MKEDINLLVIAPYYDVFIKGLTEATANYVENIDVFIHHNYITELARLSSHVPLLYLKWLEKFTKRNLVRVEPQAENVKVHILSTLYFIPDGRNIKIGDKLFKKFSQYITKHKLEFDIIHAHNHWPQGYVAVKLKKEFGVPAIVTVHTPALGEVISNLNHPIHKFASFVFKNADALIRMNKVDIPLLKKFNNNVFYVPNGFDPKLLRPMPQKEARRYLEIPNNVKMIFSLGNLVERKGFHYLIDAMSLIIRERDDVLCYIGGEGPFRNALQSKINKLNLQNHVKLLGFVSDEELSYWMNAADLFVLPSLSEGNPTVMFEALGVGLPFVGTKVGGVPEIIISEDYGLLCEPANPKDLAEKILIALEKEWDREKIRKYAEQFTWENIAKKTLEVYRGVLK